jgi:hypothetical protein
MRITLPIGCQVWRTPTSLRCVNCGPELIQCSYISAYSVFSIQLNVSALLLEISRRPHACYTSNLVTNTSHTLQFTLCELCSRTYTKYLQLRIFRLHNSAVGSSSAIGAISTIQCALYCILGARYSTHPPVYAMWPVAPDIYNAFTAPHIQTSVFIWTYLSCYWRYLDN